MMDFFTALGLFLVVEGLLLAVFPQAMQRAMRSVSEMPPDAMRIAGVVGALLGAIVVYAVKKWLL